MSSFDFKMPDVSNVVTNDDAKGLLEQIRNILVDIRLIEDRRFFLAVQDPNGHEKFVNLSQAAEIDFVSEEECHIKFAGGGVITVTSVDGVNAVISAIRKYTFLSNRLPDPPSLKASEQLKTTEKPQE